MTRNIRHFVTDIDGTLTDGKVYIGNRGEQFKAFSIKDGYALGTMLKDANIKPSIITGRTSKIVENRCHELGITSISQGVIDKLPELLRLVGEDGLESCAYFGDDTLDLACMTPVRSAGGLVGCPADAIMDVKAIAHYVCKSKAGEGAAREFIEWILSEAPNYDGLASRVERATNLLSNVADSNPKCGLLNLDNWLTIEIIETYTTLPDRLMVKSHRRCVDIHWVIEGEEGLEVADISSLVEKTPYNESTDVTIWEPRSNMSRFVLSQGSHAIFYPRDGHRTQIAVSSPSFIKIAIAKILIPGI